MASIFVWSGATGGNDGTTWEDAFTTLMKDWGPIVSAGDIVYVRSVHSETGATLIGETANSTIVPVDIRCVVGDTTGTTPGNLATGALVTRTGDIAIYEGVYIYGVDFVASNLINLAVSWWSDVVLERCTLKLTSATSSKTITLGPTASLGCRITLINTTVDFNVVGQEFLVNDIDFKWLGGTLVGNQTTLFGSQTPPRANVFVENVDLSSITTGKLLVGGSTIKGGNFNFSRCLMASGDRWTSADIVSPGLYLKAIHCQDGTDSDPAFQLHYEDMNGIVEADTATFRTGGASDGERTNPISWKMDVENGTKRSYPGTVLESPVIAGWTDGDGSTAHTYRIFFASGGTQQEDDIWFKLVGPNDAATDSLGVYPSAAADQQLGTRIDPESTPADYTTDGDSSWTGSDVGTKQYMEISYTPDKPGPISVIIYVASDAGAVGGANNAIYVDPKIYIDP